jgi:hypothetical protein
MEELRYFPDRQSVAQYLGLRDPLPFLAQAGEGRASQCVEGLAAGPAFVALQSVRTSIPNDPLASTVWANRTP